MSIFIALVACPSQEVGSSLAKTLVDKQLAACVQILPEMESVYRWKGEVCIDREVLLVIKSAEHLKDSVRECVEANHPYETPEFIVLSPTDASERYAQWLRANVLPEVS
jgi:periplasmic divalent cation tolerance protein